MKNRIFQFILFLALIGGILPAMAQYNGGVADGHASYLVPNSQPSGKDTSVQLVENEVFVFNQSLFSFTDADGIFDGIVIQQINSDGDLEYDGLNVAAGTLCRDLSKLVFKVIPEESGFPYATFRFKVRDNDGGLSALNYVFTINVVSNPKVFDKTIDITEDVTYKFNSTNLNYEMGYGRTFYRYVINTLPDSGTLYLKGLAAVVNDTFSNAADLTYKPLLNKNGNNHTMLSYKVLDDAGMYSNRAGFISINILPVNDPPFSSNVTISTFEDQQYNFSGNEFPFSDVDGHVFAGIQILTLPNFAKLKSGIKVVEQNELIIQLNTLVFIPDPQQFGSPQSTFTFKIKDTSGQLSDSTYTVFCNVQGVKDPPYGAPLVIVGEEDKIYNFSKSEFSFTDIDNDAFAGLTIGSVPVKGKLTYNGVQIGNLASVPDINKMSYVPAANLNGDSVDVFYFRVKDSSGEVSTEQYACHISLKAVNDAPVAKSFKITISEDQTYTFPKSDFKFADPDVGDTIYGLQLFYLPNKGILKYDGVPLMTGITITDFTKLTFTPAPNEFGNNYTHFGFKLIDKDLIRSIEADTVTFTVLSVFDNPVPLDTTIFATEDTKYVFKKTDFRLYDADNHFLSTIFIHSFPVAGELRYNGFTVLKDEEILEFSKLEYLPPANVYGEKIDSFSIKVKDSSGAISDTSSVVYINVAGVNDAPEGLILLSDTIAEGLAIESFVTYLRAIDPDSKLFTFELADSPDLQDADNNRFAIRDSSLITADVLDYESQSLLSIFLKVLDEESLSAEKGFFIRVLDRNETAIYEVFENEISIFPNPVANILYVILPSDRSQKYEVSINDMNGRVVSGMTTENSMYLGINISHLPEGMYMLRILGGNTSFVRQFVVKK